jgi:hypothetical protein
MALSFLGHVSSTAMVIKNTSVPQRRLSPDVTTTWLRTGSSFKKVPCKVQSSIHHWEW